MTGLQILWLLSLALWSCVAQNYTWGVEESNQTGCVSDTASCGCCLMQQWVQRLEKYFNLTLETLDRKLETTTRRVAELRASRTAFSVSLSNRLEVLGPFKTNTTVVYRKVFVNQGAAYNEQTGIFTTPVAGLYSFSFTAFHDAGAPAQKLRIYMVLQRNGQDVVGLHDTTSTDQEDSATQNVVLQLDAGDRVCVKLLADFVLFDDINHYNTFSGFFLSPVLLL
ncbi:cerebellin-3-like [Erpetoichthys calabaricus]|uniref:Cerebellin 20 n=1 Tax=Erpetoichthys calabaricus TaxID=27687 RepID=A0A8C4SQ53_ERPCA|nr:cerebellin-3-like [Erpetoichthys calabaricus]